MVIQALIIAKIDEKPGRSRIGTGHGKGNRALDVTGFDRVVSNPRFTPLRGDRGVAMDTELAHESGNHAEKGDVFKITRLNQVIESVGAVGRQRAGHINGEFALGGVKL